MRLARRNALTVLAAALAPMILRAVLLPWLPVPAPRLHDEFSHLLVADTFAHGRLVNPVHPMWPHFESMHILVRPVYASIFPVAQGIAMAAGQVVTGRPWIGVWLSMGLMCGALCWMLQGWVPPGWALLGSALAIARFGVFSYWMNSYFGGAMAAVGGALLLGTLPRFWRAPRWRHGALIGVGLLILANSRPFEGLLIAVPLMVLLVWRAPRSAYRLPTVSPLVLILVLGLTAMGAYFMRFSGSPLRLPYEFYRSTSTVAPHFIWQKPRPEPVYLHRVLWKFHTLSEMTVYEQARANQSPQGVWDKAKSYWRFYLGPFLILPLLTLPWMWRRRRIRPLLLAALVLCAGLAVEVWHAPHYAAPAMGLVLLLVVEGLRHVRQLAGRWAVAAIVAGCVLTPVVGGSGHDSSGAARAAILSRLPAGERHLVIVRYPMAHDPGDEWVYNAADIDRAPVVWAREMDTASNLRLIGYFEGRRVWLLEPDRNPVALTPFADAGLPDPPLRFVRLGTEGVEGLRSAEEVRQQVLKGIQGECDAACRQSCDWWNFVFTKMTGVEGPPVESGCVPGADRSEPVSFDHWFNWLQKRR